MLALEDIAPMLLTDRRPPVPAPGWLYELKHDGYRVLARLARRQVHLRTRNGTDCSGWYPEIVQSLVTLAGHHVLDGEVCVLDDIGRPDFERLQERSRRRRWYAGCDPVAFMAFDLLVHRGADVRAWPVERRKAALQQLLTPPPHGVLYVGHVTEGGAELYAHACALQLEGIVCKRLGSPYASGERNGDWLKIKRPGAVFADTPAPRAARSNKAVDGSGASTKKKRSCAADATTCSIFNGCLWPRIGRRREWR